MRGVSPSSMGLDSRRRATSTGTLYLASDPGGNDIGTYTLSASVLSTTLVDDYAASTEAGGRLECRMSTKIQVIGRKKANFSDTA
jgi:hypothetical protein